MSTMNWATLWHKCILQHRSNAVTKNALPLQRKLSNLITAQVFLGSVHRASTYTSMLLNGSSDNCNSRSNDTKTVLWHPSAVLSGCQQVGNGHACVVLNRSIAVPVVAAQQIWQNAQMRCLVDGGANYWRNFIHRHCAAAQMKQPEFITGDFDSITKETRAFFNDPTTKHIHTPDQDETDFTKALRTLQPHLEQQNLHDVVVLQENTGRLDQIMANINTLYKLQSTALNVHLLSSACLTWLLLPGKHIITIPKELVASQRWCALMPIGSAARNVTTTGLKWDLSHSLLAFGSMVSTSNTYASTEVTVESDSHLVWSMGVDACKGTDESLAD